MVSASSAALPVEAVVGGIGSRSAALVEADSDGDHLPSLGVVVCRLDVERRHRGASVVRSLELHDRRAIPPRD
jgi:hypothetical protein